MEAQLRQRKARKVKSRKCKIMIKKYLGILFLASVCCSYGQEDPGKQLIRVMGDLKDVTEPAASLAKNDFPAINARFKNDSMHVGLVGRPLTLANVVTELDLGEVSRLVNSKDKLAVTQIVLALSDEVRGLGGVLLAEALVVPDSIQSMALLDLYQAAEAGLNNMLEAYRAWIQIQ